PLERHHLRVRAGNHDAGVQRRRHDNDPDQPQRARKRKRLQLLDRGRSGRREPGPLRRRTGHRHLQLPVHQPAASAPPPPPSPPPRTTAPPPPLPPPPLPPPPRRRPRPRLLHPLHPHRLQRR